MVENQRDWKKHRGVDVGTSQSRSVSHGVRRAKTLELCSLRTGITSKARVKFEDYAERWLEHPRKHSTHQDVLPENCKLGKTITEPMCP